MPRLTVFLEQVENGPAVILSDRESHHLVKVLRARTGDAVTALDGEGTRLAAILKSADPKAAELEVTGRESIPRPSPEVVLAQALPKGKAFEHLLRTAVEIGVSAVIPLHTRHVEGRPQEKFDRWILALQEACKQSGNPWLPDLLPPQPLDAFLLQPPPGDFLVAALHPEARPVLQVLGEVLPARPGTLTIAVGPEGDFAPDELEALIRAGARPVSLGPHILRTETAAPVALSAIRQAVEASRILRARPLPYSPR